MNKITVRFVILVAATMLCLLAQHPRQADAAACPTLSCATFENECAQRHCAVVSSILLRTCTVGGEYLVRCTCMSSICSL
jgi:hypothetical protein